MLFNNRLRTHPITKWLKGAFQDLARLVRRDRKTGLPPMPKELKDLEPSEEEWAVALRIAEHVVEQLERRQRQLP